MFTIPVYKHEKKLGLTEIIQANSSVAYNQQLKNAKPILEAFAKPKLVLATNMDQIDLYYFASILVSTTWNLNDDVFGRDQVWAARKTPEDKQINIEHQHEAIIGHITSVAAINADDYSIISDDVEKLPDMFHLITSGVIYRKLKTEELQERVDAVIEKIEAGKMYVSMECLFRDFDYAIRRADGATGVLPRNDETSYLTKHLRAYGGKGEYNGVRVGRYLKKLVFSGKGMTENPANSDENGPISITFTQDNYDEIFTESTVGVKNMSKELEDKVTDAEKKVTDLEAKLEKALADVKAGSDKVLDLEASLKTANESLAKATKDHQELTDKYSELEKKSIRTDRVAKLVAEGKSKEDAEKFVDKFASLNDEMFNEVASLAKKDKADEEDEDEEDEETEAALENAEPKKDVNLANASPTTDELNKKIADFLSKSKE